jgi:hypothetical protein
MFLGISTKAAYIKGKKNMIADYLSHLHQQEMSHSFVTPLLYSSGSLSSKVAIIFTPSAKLLVLVSTSLLTGSVSIPTGRVVLGQILASRVSWYRDNFCKCHNIVDSYLLDVNNYQEANLLFACYAVFLTLGHTLLCKTIKSQRLTIILVPQPTLSSKLAFKYAIQPTISAGMIR